MPEYIERSKVLAEYDRQHEGAPGRARKIIEDFPAADVVEVRHGRWIMTKDGTAYCSACKRKMNPYLYGYAHCAMCGARMDGGVNRIEIDTVKDGGVNDAAD